MPTSRQNPFLATIKERYRLNGDGAGKCTIHVVLDLAGSDIEYRPGDSIGIFPRNHPELVEKTLQAFSRSGEEVVATREGVALSLREFLSTKANLHAVTKKLLTKVEPDSPLLTDRAVFKSTVESHHVWDFIDEQEVDSIEASELPSLLMPLLPRLYSIASSREAAGSEVHLTIATLDYETNGEHRHGVCSDYLWSQAPLNEAIVPIYLQPTKEFLLPENGETPIIMIGPGTGVAPFRAFMQERAAQGATGKNWLFFGEWNQGTDFYYEAEWKKYVDSGQLELSTAFSRDQAHKIYVQDRMRERAPEIWSWLKDGAVLYVCGDMHRMAKDVDATLHKIVEQQGGCEAKEFVKALRKEKRYLRDVY